MSTKRTQPERQAKRIGRPPAGAREGERVKDYPQLSVRLPEDVRAKLQALSMVTTKPQWRLITDAIECYLLERPEQEQRLVDELINQMRRRHPSRTRRR